MSTRREKAHLDLIVQQFSKQSVPFSEMRQRSHEEAIELLMRATRVTALDTALDVACGPGLVALAFAKVARQVVGIDVTPAMIDRARALQAERDLPNVSWQIGDVAHLPFPDDTFTIVTCRYALHHVFDPRAVAAEMVRVCAPGGRVALVDVVTTAEKSAAYNRMEKLRDPSHVRALKLDELFALATQNGLVLMDSQFYRMEVELETLLRGSFSNAGDEAQVREMLVQDIGHDVLGASVSLRGTETIVAYPIALVVGEKRPSARARETLE